MTVRGPLESPEMCSRVFDTVLEGFILLSDIKSRLLEQMAWKYLHPAVDANEGGASSGAAVYQRVRRISVSTLINLTLVVPSVRLSVRI